MYFLVEQLIVKLSWGEKRRFVLNLVLSFDAFIGKRGWGGGIEGRGKTQGLAHST